MSAGLAARLHALLAAREPVVLVTIRAAEGSTPREAGAAMLVTGAGAYGTIGGGQLEWDAIARARALLESGERSARMDVPLGPAIGQCCGGRVGLALVRAGQREAARLEAEEAAAQTALPQVLLFGAGHVGRALARALAPLPLQVRWIDGRAYEFTDPPPEGVEVVVSGEALAEVEAAPTRSAYLVLTHSHALDSLLCAAVLQRGDFAYLGLIGSRSKRARFVRGFRDLGIAEREIARLVCPIGGAALRDKRPEVIAALTVAELLHALAPRDAAFSRNAASQDAGVAA